jgi:hypothetical protein
MTDREKSFLSVQQVILGENDVVRSCTLLFTTDGIIVVFIEGLSNWTVAIVIVALAAGFVGLLVRNSLLFLSGLTIGIVAGLFIGLFDIMLRRKKLGNVKRLDPDDVLHISNKNFEIPYTRISKVEVATLSSYPAASYLFPSFQEDRYRFDFITEEGKQTFVLNRNSLHQCLNKLRQLAPKTEIEGILLDE